MMPEQENERRNEKESVDCKPIKPRGSQRIARVSLVS